MKLICFLSLLFPLSILFFFVFFCLGFGALCVVCGSHGVECGVRLHLILLCVCLRLSLRMSSLSLSSLSLSSSTDPVLIEVHRQLCATRDRLTHWQADCVDRLLAQPESRLQQKLVAYINNVADVEAFEADIAQSTAIAPSPLQTPVAAPIDAASHTAADDEEDEDAPAAAPKEIDPVKAHLIAPKRTHPSFEACIIDATLTLMEEEWNQLFNQCTTADGHTSHHTPKRPNSEYIIMSLTYLTLCCCLLTLFSRQAHQ